MIEEHLYKFRYQFWFSVDAFCYLIFAIRILELQLRRIHPDRGNFQDLADILGSRNEGTVGVQSVECRD